MIADFFWSVRSINDNRIVIADLIGIIKTPIDIKTTKIGNAVINLQTERYRVDYSSTSFEKQESAEESIRDSISIFIKDLKRTLNV